VPAALETDFSTTGPNEWLLAEMPFSNAEVSFTAVAADAELAEFLGNDKGEALFRMERATWFRHKPVTFVRMTFHAGYRM
ncbi:UTRA domain-containing protein, partial [bacterium LRH843]|nr:UTRA domain-containing protein [bacterium LRH843]